MQCCCRRIKQRHRRKKREQKLRQRHLQCRRRRVRELLQQMQTVRDNWTLENCSHECKFLEPTSAHENCCDKCKQPGTTGLSRTVAKNAFFSNPTGTHQECCDKCKRPASTEHKRTVATNANGQSQLVRASTVAASVTSQSQLGARGLLQQTQMVRASWCA